MSIISIDPKLIDPNPYQPRGDLGDLTGLAESIKSHGLLERPSVRAVGKRYQLQFGHRRTAAWQLAKPGEPIEVELVEATDQQMFEASVIENEHRKEMTPIDRAKAMKQYIETFGATQAEAGKLFGLATQGAVSNSMRLLKLPIDVQELVARGEIAERDIRRLLPLLKLPSGPKAITDLAQHAAKQDVGDRSLVIENGLGRILDREAIEFERNIWDLSWPAQPIELTLADWPKGTPGQIGPCKGCEFFIKQGDDTYCLRKPCYLAKDKLHRSIDLERVSKKLKIPILGKEETGTLIELGYISNFGERALRVKGREEFLRLRLQENRHYYNGRAQELLGSYNAELMTIDMAGLKRFMPKENVKAKKEEAWHRRQRLQQQRVDEITGMVNRAAAHFTALLPDNPVLLRMLDNDPDETKTRTNADLKLRIMREALLTRVPHSRWNDKHTPAKAIEEVKAIAGELKVKLPKGWQVPPAEPKGKKK